MHARVPLLLLAFLLLLASGCRKDKDGHGPVIEIISPGSGSLLTVPDTLAVLVHVSDDRKVETVWISLADHNGVPIAATIVVSVNAPSTTIEREIIVENELITSGNYSLSVRASDGTNTTSAFRSVNISGSPLRLRALFIIPPSSGTITRIDSAGSQSAFATVQNISGAEINSAGQHLYLATEPFAAMQVMAASDQGSAWQMPNQNAQTGPYFTDLRTDPKDHRTYVSSNEGAIRAFRANSTPQFNAQAFPGFRPFTNVVVGDRLISEQRSIGSIENRLVSYAYSSGALLETFPLDLEVVRMFEHSAQQALIFGNRDGEGSIHLRNVIEGGNYEMRVFDEGEIIAVEKLSATTYVVLLPTRIIRFTYSNNSVLTLLNTSAVDIAYDRASGSLYAGAGQQIQVIDPSTGSVVNNISVPTVIGRILPLLNR